MLDLPTGPVLLFRDPDLALVVVSDCGNMGPNLVHLSYQHRLFATSCLLGGDESVCRAVRFLAPQILAVDEDGVADAASFVSDKKEVLVSFSVRDHGREVLQAIATELQKHNVSPDAPSSCRKCFSEAISLMRKQKSRDEENCRVLAGTTSLCNERYA